MDFYVNAENNTDPLDENKRYFRNQLSEYVYYSKYSRWRSDLGRRETWPETVERATNHLRYLSNNELDESVYERIYNSMLHMNVMPSMRLMAMAGKAAERNPISIFNCASISIDAIDAFVEVMYLSMNGVGVGFSVEKQFTDCLPMVERQQISPRGTHLFVVPDSTEGWCDAFKAGLSAWFNGYDVVFDTSHVRPAGTPLRTKGGTASGPRPLTELLEFAREKILSRQGQRLSTLDVYDIVCKIADCVVMGGVRRSAAIALFDIDDDAMTNAKNESYWAFAPWRANANNSVVWTNKLSREEINKFFDTMHIGLNGEPGFFSRRAALETMPLRRNRDQIFGTNACGESVLRMSNNGGGLCNLSSVVARPHDTVGTLCHKMETAAIIGTIQSMSTNFHYLRSGWQKNAEEERLLGVDLTGHFDSRSARNALNQIAFKSTVVRTNRAYARKLGIPTSMATTLVKPSGNSGLLLDVSSGVHPRWSRYYKRNVRVNKDSPLFEVFRASGIDMVKESDKTYVVGFAIKSPDNARTRHELSALEHLNYWKQVKTCYAEHSVSMTCYYDEHEIDDVKNWLYENQDVAIGVTFLPRSNTHYDNAPYVDLTRGEYEALKASEPVIDYRLLAHLESTDQTTSAQELACVSGQCDFQM